MTAHKLPPRIQVPGAVRTEIQARQIRVLATIMLDTLPTGVNVPGGEITVRIYDPADETVYLIPFTKQALRARILDLERAISSSDTAQGVKDIGGGEPL